MIQKFIDTILDSSRKDLVRGKQLAASIMLDGIFSILQAWSAVNLSSFLSQFQQFYSVVRVPMVHTGKPQEWTELKYEVHEVPGCFCLLLKNAFD